MIKRYYGVSWICLLKSTVNLTLLVVFISVGEFKNHCYSCCANLKPWYYIKLCFNVCHHMTIIMLEWNSTNFVYLKHSHCEHVWYAVRCISTVHDVRANTE